MHSLDHAELFAYLEDNEGWFSADEHGKLLLTAIDDAVMAIDSDRVGEPMEADLSVGLNRRLILPQNLVGSRFYVNGTALDLNTSRLGRRGVVLPVDIPVGIGMLVRLHYLGMPMDAEGFPMVNESLLPAVVLWLEYRVKRFMRDRYVMGKTNTAPRIDVRELQYLRQSALDESIRLRGAINMPTVLEVREHLFNVVNQAFPYSGFNG